MSFVQFIPPPPKTVKYKAFCLTALIKRVDKIRTYIWILKGAK